MAELSRFWDADALVAEPYIYSADEFAEAENRSLQRSGTLLGQNNELEVDAPGGTKTVTVNTGQAILRGYWYQNSASKALTIDDTIANPRIDRIVLRWVAATRTITALVLKGVEAATPSPKALTQTAATWEEPLARVYVANPSVNLTSANIGEDRKFLQPYSRSYQRQLNQIENGHAEGASIAGWAVSNGTLEASTTQKNWGEYSFKFTASAIGGYMRYVLPDEKTYARPYYVRAKVWAEVGEVTMDVNGAGVAKDFPRNISSSTAAWTLLEGTYMGDGSGVVNLDFIATNNNDVFYVDEVMVMEGGSYDLYVPGIADVINYSRVGQGIIQLLQRQGGSATVWETAGTTDYDLRPSTAPKIKAYAGCVAINVLMGANAATAVITFPSAFAYFPMTWVSFQFATVGAIGGIPYRPVCSALGGSTTQVTIEIAYPVGNLDGAASSTVNWLTIGPEA